MAKDWKHYLRRSRSQRIALNHAYKPATTTQNGEEYFPRQDIQQSTVFDLVYRYLRKVADRDSKWKQRNSACDKFHRQHARRKDIHERPVTRIWTDVGAEIRDNSERSRSRVRKSTPKMFRAPRSSSQEYIADYKKAVHDGRKRVRFYVRDALLYGLQSGLLVPTSRRANILRVSQELGIFPSKNLEGDEENQSSIMANNV